MDVIMLVSQMRFYYCSATHEVRICYTKCLDNIVLTTVNGVEMDHNREQFICDVTDFFSEEGMKWIIPFFSLSASYP